MSKVLDHHPLETTFGMLSGTMEMNSMVETEDNYMSVPASDVEQPYKDDEEDKDITVKIETIYDTALEAYNYQVGMAETVDPRYAARQAEVAAQYLSLALNATALKAKTKEGKRKAQQFIPFSNTNISNSNVVVADRNEMLRMMREKKEKEIAQ